MLEDPTVRLPGHASVPGAEEHARIASEPECPRLARRAGLDVPRRVQLEAALLGQTELLGALPVGAFVARAVDGGAVERVVRGRVENPVAPVADGVVVRPAREEGTLDLPRFARVVSMQEEEPFSRRDG
jgi:hypothetical protein